MTTLEYLNYVIGCMTSATNSNVSTNIKDSTYHLVIMDDLYNEYGGSYFKVVKLVTSSKALTSADVYEVDIGYPTNTLVMGFDIVSDDSYSILYNYANEVAQDQYKYTIDNDGHIRTQRINTASSLTTNFEIDKTWWTRMTQFPIKATLTIKGLLRPAILMTYIKVNSYFYGQKHVSSGTYIITRQEDKVDANGYRTTLSLTRIAGDDDYAMGYTQSIVNIDNQSDVAKYNSNIQSIAESRKDNPVYNYGNNKITTTGDGEK